MTEEEIQKIFEAELDDDFYDESSTELPDNDSDGDSSEGWTLADGVEGLEAMDGAQEVSPAEDSSDDDAVVLSL